MRPWRNPRVVVPCWAACGAALIAANPSAAALLAPVAWPFVEYAAHRWAMHSLARFSARAYRKAHGVHHGRPLDTSHFVVPPLAVASATLVMLACLPTSFVGGLIVCLAAYDVVHLGCHGLGPLASITPRYLVSHHKKHHADAATCFSVTVPALDRIAGTA